MMVGLLFFFIVLQSAGDFCMGILQPGGRVRDFFLFF